MCAELPQLPGSFALHRRWAPGADDLPGGGVAAPATKSAANYSLID